MARRKIPRLRTVDKTLPLYPLNRFPKNFAFNLGREIVYVLATKGSNVLEGSEWEKIFADCIGANWRPSNVGLDDVIFQSCAWGAKTVKSSDLTKLNVFEFDTVRYEPDLFEWKWNRNENLEGYSKSQMEHIFTWQPHGSQF